MTNTSARQIVRNATGAVTGLVTGIVKGSRKDAPTESDQATAAPVATKQARLLEMLKRPEGATLEELIAVTGWQAHSVRGAISGTLKKKLGLPVTSGTVEGRGRVYRIGGEG
ncbi:DUF3489 domain-containing protein [Magnetospirillum sp. 15-1]|uniref:DUF3489 domain-containing protein n=1 Tax=Magnetospirillum sp. 15-1 TaxID=1979370 RepID=UPI001F5B71C6|nr:DUF3489 domain-containing protein [Magnetospirillum sp. 15-1]